MSAQDDVLAAFGELPRKTKTAGAGAGEEALAEQAEAGADTSEQASELAHGSAATAAVLAGASAGESATGGTDTSKQAPELAHGSAATAAEQVGAVTGAGAGDSATGGAALVGGDQAEPGAGTRADAAIGGDPAEIGGEAGAGEQVSEPIDAAAGQQNSQPHQPYLDPAAFFAELQAESAPQPKAGRRRLVLRYAAALGLALAVGAGTAFAVSLPRRTDVPFLATPGDGRYTFPAAARPAPPSGKPGPNSGSNIGQVHYGDLRQYLLPAPAGALPKEDGWERVADFESSLSGSDVSNHLYDAGLRRVAWRGWSAVDGQHTVVELLQFPDREAAADVESMLDDASLAKARKLPEGTVPQVSVRALGDVAETAWMHTFDQVDGLPGQVERRIVFASGDVVAIVTTTAPAKVSGLTTEQVAMLQAEMLR